MAVNGDDVLSEEIGFAETLARRELNIQYAQGSKVDVGVGIVQAPLHRSLLANQQVLISGFLDEIQHSMFVRRRKHEAQHGMVNHL